MLWFDTLLVAAMIGAKAGGIYAAGTRYLLIGTFVVEAIMQAVGPRVSGLLTLGHKDEAREVVHQTTTWQVAIVWPTYLVVGLFATVLLGVFGPEFVAAEAALVFLSIGMLVSCLGGPCDSVILMSGRSRQSLINSAAALTINVVGNLILVPEYGISAAGFVWAVTLVVAAGLPAIQTSRHLQISPWSMPMVRTMVLALVTVGVPCVVARLTLGETWAGLLAALVVGGAAVFGAHVAAAAVDTSRRPSRQLSSDPAPGAARDTHVGATGMPQEREAPTLADYAAIVARRWRVVVITTLVFMLLGAAWSIKGGSTYTSNASLVIRPILSDPFGTQARIEDVGANTQAKVLDSTVVANEVAKRLKLDRDPKDLVNRLVVENPVGTLVLNIAFTATTPERAQAGARAFAQAYLDYRRAERGGHEEAHARAVRAAADRHEQRPLGRLGHDRRQPGRQ